MSLVSKKVNSTKTFGDISKGDSLFVYSVSWYDVHVIKSIDDIINRMKSYCEAIAIVTNYKIEQNDTENIQIKYLLITHNKEKSDKVTVKRNKDLQIEFDKGISKIFSTYELSDEYLVNFINEYRNRFNLN